MPEMIKNQNVEIIKQTKHDKFYELEKKMKIQE